MACLIGCLALFTPRVAIVAVYLFSDYLGHAYETILWPVLGFFFMPVTTLAYAWGVNTHGAIEGIFLVVVVIAVLMIFTLNLHHTMLAAVIDSYQLFVPGQVPPVADFADMVTRVVAKTFLLSFQIAAPFVVMGLIFFLGVGILGRLMPQMQVFFVAMPLQIAAGLAVLALVLPAIMRWFINAFQESLMPFVAL